MINTLSPTQKAWLAGFINGEGFIGVTFQRKKENKTQSSSLQYHPYLIVTNNDQNSILYVKKLVGEGRIYRLTRSVIPSSPATFQYKLCKREVLLALLKELQPYLVVKLRQSELVLEHIRLRQKCKVVTGGGSRGKTSFSGEEENIYQKLLLLNKRGERKKNEPAAS